MKRSQARQEVFQLLFESAFSPEASADEILRRAAECRDLEPDAYIASVFPAVLAHAPQLDAVIDRYSQDWKADRLSRPALCAARLAIYEILYSEDVPAAIAINEAVELIKKFGDEPSAKYVNGFLGAFVRDRDEEPGV